MQPNLEMCAATQLRTPREQTLRRIGYVFSTLVWLALAVSIIGALYGILIAVGLLVAHAIFLAHVRGNGVRLGPRQLPHLYAKVIEASKSLGLASPPEVYVLQAHGVLNAFATKVLGRRFVILHSDLIDACELARRTGDGHAAEIDFIIAHEIGHLAAGHLSWFLLPVRIVPLFGPAYSRACEYTCDRCGHALVGDLEVSSRALAILAAGGRAGRQLDLDEFMAQRQETRSFWMAVYELNASHPYLSKRVAALREFAQPGTVPAVGRSWGAYPLAPLLSFATGGPSAAALFVVALIGILSVIAVPAFKKYQQRVKAVSSPSEVALDDLTADVQGDNDLIRGDWFGWRLKRPGARWQLLPNEAARQKNPLADRWLVRPDLDAHVLVIGEALGGQELPLNAVVEAVLANARQAMPDLTVVSQKPIGKGRLVRVEGTSKGVKMIELFAVFVDGNAVYQVLAFAPKQAMPSVESELMAAISSFEPGPVRAPQ